MARFVIDRNTIHAYSDAPKLRPSSPTPVFATMGRVSMFQPGQRVRLNLAGLFISGVSFGAAVTDAMGTIVRQISADPPRYLVKLLFAFKGLTEVEVPEDRIKAG